MKARIVFFAIGKLYDLINHIVQENNFDTEITVYSSGFDQAITDAKRLQYEGKTDIIITGGATYKKMLLEIDLPVIPIRISGFDLISIIHESYQTDNKVAIFTYEHPLKESETIAKLLNIDIKVCSYTDPDDVRKQIQSLLSNGYKNIIGTASVIDIAEELGAHTFLIYRTDAIFKTIDLAKQIICDKKYQQERDNTLRSIMEFTSDGIIAVNKEGVVTAFNPAASKILKISTQEAMSKEIDKVFCNTRLSDIIKSGKAQYNEIQTVNNINIITNRIPITVGNNVIGAVATFQDATTIQQAESNLRLKLHSSKGLYAKCHFEDLIGNNPKFLETIQQAKRYARTEFTITILGESGTGKELFAQSIHNASLRKNNPFVAVNCAALPENLLESELFGYDEGAFTGAKKGGKLGLFEMAHSGTIFLDEISELSLPLQGHLLRVIQEREIIRLGGQKVIPIDVRIIAASNKNLKDHVDNEKFRADLFYRLNVLNLKLQPIRDYSKKDIFTLFLSFVSNLDPILGEHVKEQESVVTHHLGLYDWPGNVRELQNFTYRFIVLTQTDNICQIIQDQLQLLIPNQAPVDVPKIDPGYYRKEKKSITREDVELAIHESGGNKAEAARRLGINRTTLWRWIK